MKCTEDKIKRELRYLQDRTHLAFDHLYLFYYKTIIDEDTFDIGQNLSKEEKYFLCIEAEASLKELLLIIRSLFDIDQKSLSIFNFFKKIVSEEMIADESKKKLFYQYKENKSKITDEIYKNILGEDHFSSFENVKNYVNKHLAHSSKNANKRNIGAYQSLENLLFRIENILFKELPLQLFKETDNLMHEDKKNKIRKYLEKLYVR